METFGARLRAAMDEHGPLCVGIDPHPYLLRRWGLTDDAAGLERFAMTCADSLCGRVAVLKPQSAFFERHGAAGIAVLERLLSSARAAGTLVLADVKRGDIGSTMQGYADAYLSASAPLAVDAITVSPYLGFGSLRPVLDTAAAHGRGVFVLAATSNPDGAEVQLAETGGVSVAARLLAEVAAENDGATPMGSVGAVVGANQVVVPVPEKLNGPVLAPGVGAQGGNADTIRAVFGTATHHVLASASRSILEHGPAPDDLQAATTQTLNQVRAALAGGK